MVKLTRGSADWYLVTGLQACCCSSPHTNGPVLLKHTDSVRVVEERGSTPGYAQPQVHAVSCRLLCHTRCRWNARQSAHSSVGECAPGLCWGVLVEVK